LHGLRVYSRNKRDLKKYIGTNKEKNSIETFANVYKIARPTTIARLATIILF